MVRLVILFSKEGPRWYLVRFMRWSKCILRLGHIRKLCLVARITSQGKTVTEYLLTAKMKIFSTLTLSVLLSGINGLVIRDNEVTYHVEGLEMLNSTPNLDKRANYEFKE
jgi:hypothetical protein